MHATLTIFCLILNHSSSADPDEPPRLMISVGIQHVHVLGPGLFANVPYVSLYTVKNKFSFTQNLVAAKLPLISV